MAQEKTKKIKARVIEEGDLTFAVIEVPASDPRPEFDPAQHSLNDPKGVGSGNPMAGKSGSVIGID